MFSLSSFTKEQQRAILHDKGPVLIIAGAGTGKTNVLTGKMLYLILQKKLKPSEILALTFTEKACNEMIERVDMELPFGYEEAWIKTFHGFCDSVLRERGLDIGLPTDYVILSDADQWMFFKKHLFKFDLDYFRPLSNPSKFISALLNHFSRLKDEAIVPETYIEHCKKMLKNAVNEEEKLSAKKIYEAAKAYKTYQQLLLEENALDYGDLILYTLNLFKSRGNVLKEYQSRFKHILVDEFQDTNYAQNQLILLLAKAHKNLFVVGDDDQSIYKWRGASVANILNFEKNFPDAKKIVLTKNFRNAQKILNAGYEIIQHNNPHRLETLRNVSKKMKAVRKIKGKAQVYHFDHYLQEIDFIVNKIKKLSDAELDCAILVRANDHARPFLEAFKKLDIPYQYCAETNIFQKPEIKDILCLLRFLSDFTDDIAFFRILSMPIWKIKMKTLVSFMNEAKYSHDSLYEFLCAKKMLDSDIRKIIDILAFLIEYSKDHSLSEVIGKFLEKSAYWKLLTKEDSAENIEKLQALADFSLKIKEFELKHKDHRIADFVEYIRFFEEAGEKRTLPESLDRTIPKILTVHSAKGLEFDTVFLPCLVAGKFPSISRKEPIDIPEKLIPEILPSENLHLEEERRLFYVGLTRAKSNVILTYSDLYEGAKRFKPSPFILEIQKSLKKSMPAREKIKPISLPPIAKERKHRPLPKFTINLNKLSYSQFDVFKTCPFKYRFRYLLRIPSPLQHTASFGTSIHETLKSFYRLLIKEAQNKRMFFMSKRQSKTWRKKLHEIYEKHWMPFGYPSREYEKACKKQGLEILNNFFEKQKQRWVIPAYIEKNFKLKTGRVCLEGRMDRIDQCEDGTYEVIDYKTGKIKDRSELKKDLQMPIYALACETIFHLPISKLSFYFIKDNVKLTINAKEIDFDKVKLGIKKLVQTMNASDFAPAPGFQCSWCEYRTICNFVKTPV